MSIYNKEIQLYIQVKNIDIEKVKREAKNNYILLHENFMVMIEYNDCFYKTKISWKHDEKIYLHDIFLIPYVINKNECYILLYDINKKTFTKNLLKKIRCKLNLNQLELYKLDCFDIIMGSLFYDHVKSINELQQKIFNIENQNKETNNYINQLEKKNNILITKLNLIKNILI